MTSKFLMNNLKTFHYIIKAVQLIVKCKKKNMKKTTLELVDNQQHNQHKL